MCQEKMDKKQKVGNRKVNPPASTTHPLVQGKDRFVPNP